MHKVASRVRLSVCHRLSVRLSVQKTPVLQIQVALLVLNTFKLCKTLKNCLATQAIFTSMAIPYSACLDDVET